MSGVGDDGTLATMRSQRVLPSLAVVCLGVGVGFGTCSLAPQEPGDEALRLSVASLGF